MQKILFKDAFSDIELDEDVSVYFDEVWVTNMTFVKNSKTLFVSILSNHHYGRVVQGQIVEVRWIDVNLECALLTTL